MAKYEFENKLNDCLEKLLSGTETVEQCLQRYPDDAQELEPLLRTAMSVHKTVDITPSPELKARIRYNLQLKMAEVGKPRRASWFSMQPRWATAMTAVMLVFVLGGGAVLAADSSMPGSPLYPLKILTENISLKLAGSDIEKAELSLTFADRRVEEINYLIENDKLTEKNMEATADRYIAYVNQVNSLSSEQAVSLKSTGAADATREAAAPESSQTVTGTVTAPPPETEETTEPSLAAPQVTLEVPPDETETSSAESQTFDKQDELYQMITYYAYHHPQKLTKWLEDPNIPEKYKILIRRMIQDMKNLEYH
jgi:hypothetical protein